ncbi:MULTISPECIES: hypothetical protein [Saccharothrix]|uniref:hypothetical protein n=1 Tax=Saccharothrix TaxID=2071 RepID=UPI0018E963E0|nr:hypothetical protein [Saccharothrix sp. CB00851]
MAVAPERLEGDALAPGAGDDRGEPVAGDHDPVTGDQRDLVPPGVVVRATGGR